MNTCAEIRERLSEFIDGALDPEAASALQAHLDSCPSCRLEWSSLQDVSKALGNLEPVNPPDDFFDRLQERIASQSLFKRLFQWLFSPLRIKLPLELATAAAVGVFLFFILTPERAMRQVMAPAPALLSEEAEKAAPAPYRTAPERKREKKAVPVGGDLLKDASEKGQEPLEIVIRMEAPVKASGKTSGKEAPMTPQASFQSAPVKSFDPPPAPAAKETAVRFAQKKKDEGAQRHSPEETLGSRETAEAQVVGRIVQAGGRVVESFEKDKEKILVCRIPEESLGGFQEGLKSLKAVVSFPEIASLPSSSFIEIRVRILFGD